MPINNPPGEQHREQLKMHAEELQGKIDEIIKELNDVLGPGNYNLDQEGNVSCELSDLELGSEKAQVRVEVEEKLKKIYAEIKKIDPDVWKESLNKAN